MEVTDDLVRHVARLSRLAISPEEARGMKTHFEKILGFISSFQALDTRDVDPSMFSVEASNVYREDEPRASLSRADALRNAPKADGTYFVVPRIVGEVSTENGAAPGPTPASAPGSAPGAEESGGSA